MTADSSAGGGCALINWRDAKDPETGPSLGDLVDPTEVGCQVAAIFEPPSSSWKAVVTTATLRIPLATPDTEALGFD